MAWICNGEPRNTGFLHLTSFPHEPTENMEQFCIVCGLPKAAVDSNASPSHSNITEMREQLLDRRYKIIGFLAKGGFGETYRAEDTRTFNSQCFIKQLKPANTEGSALVTARRLFESEAKTLNRLGYHNQIPKLLAYFEQDTEFYLVQELIEGNPVNHELSVGKSWRQEQVVHLLTEVLEVLYFVHNQGVIHRDIKPHNLIRRSEDNKLVLVDFGAVKQVRKVSSTEISVVTISIGTNGYTAPEQLRGKPNFSSDIYSLGVLGIQALTGMNPHNINIDRDGELIWKQDIQVSEQL